MNFLNLKYFIVAAEEMNFTKAAKRLYISQQSLSNHIAKLEDYFGVQLFDRNTPLTLTVAGQRLLKNAQTIMDVKKQTELELQDIRDFRSAELTIGIPSARGSVMLPPLIQKFHREFPQVQLHLLEGTSLEITEALYKGKVDFTIGFEPDDLGNIYTEVLQEEHTMILVPAAILEQFFDSSERKKLEAERMLPIRVFKSCPFIKMKHENWIGAVFEKSCQDGGFNPHVVLETANIMTMISLCISGLGIIVVPRVFLSENSPMYERIREEGARMFILDYPLAHKHITINYLKNKYQTKAAREFISMTRQVLGGY